MERVTAKAPAEADRRTRAGHHRTLSKDEADHVRASRAECDAHRDLARALRHCICHHAMDGNRGQ
jgi:hypothetical protein